MLEKLTPKQLQIVATIVDEFVRLNENLAA